MAIPKGYRLLEGSQRDPVPGATQIGAAEASEVMSVTVAVRRRPGAPQVPDHGHWASQPPAEREYLTPEAYAAEYGASDDDLAAVATFAARHGLEVTEANATQRIVILSGRAGDVAKAFGVTLSLDPPHSAGRSVRG